MAVNSILSVLYSNVGKLFGIAKSGIGKIMGILVGGSEPVYEVDYSCRFNNPDSPYLTKTFSGAGNRKTWTLSMWAKLGSMTTSVPPLFDAYVDGNYRFRLIFGPQYMQVVSWANSLSINCDTVSFYRDPSAWYHIVVALDTTQATNTNRFKLYVNGVQYTGAVATYPTQNDEGAVGAACVHRVGGYGEPTVGYYFNGYISDVYMINGQQLTPSSFGEISATTGAWIPKAYAGTYGTNGFHLDFANASDLGNDISGNNNDFTSSGLTTTDQITDSPTNNFCVLNPLDIGNGGGTLTEGNLKFVGNGASYPAVRSTLALTYGKWYWEVKVTSAASNGSVIGVLPITSDIMINDVTYVEGIGHYFYSTYSKYVKENSEFGSPASITTGDIISIAIDTDNRKIWFGLNGTWYGSGNPAAGTNETTTLTIGKVYSPTVESRSSALYANFGQDSANVASGNTDSNGIGNFEYAPPTNFLAVCSYNLETPSIVMSSTAFDTILYTGDGTAPRTLSGLSFQSDMVWSKNRSDNVDHTLMDSVRGFASGKQLYPNETYHEGQYNSYGYLSGVSSTGFTIGAAGSYYNYNTHNYVNWCWKKGAAYGFDIVAYTGTGSVQNINHSLGIAPKLLITKERNATSAQDWYTLHMFMATDPETDWMALDTGGGASDNNTVWNDTAPTATQFTVGANTGNNESGKDHVAYLWSEIEGFSKFSYFIGNGSTNGTFVYCGFKPKLIIWKHASGYLSGAGSWTLIDAERDTYNVSNHQIWAETTSSESTSYNVVDLLANGFKLRHAGYDWNYSGDRYIFMAWAETPFKYSTAR